VSRGSRVQILFTDLDLEQASQCRFDYVQLYDGPNSAAKSLGKKLSILVENEVQLEKIQFNGGGGVWFPVCRPIERSLPQHLSADVIN
jgi:hypothetical protein